MNVSDIMSPHIVSIRHDEPVSAAARLLTRHNLGSLPVCGADGNLRGMVTARDIVLRCVAAEEDPLAVPVGDIMSRRCATVPPDADVREAARRMAAEQVRRLPVVEDGRLVGILSLGDLARCGRYEMEVSQALTVISDHVRRP